MTTQEKMDAIFLEHFGVKGMRWGVRKVRGSDSEGRSRFNPDFQKKEGRTALDDGVTVGAGVVVPIFAPFTIPAQVRLVRRATRNAREDAVKKSDRKFEDRANSQKNVQKIHNASVDALNREQTRINKKYKGLDLTDPKNAAKQRKYMEETADMMAREYQRTANSMKNASGTKQYDVQMHGDGHFKIVAKKIKHADGDETILLLQPVLKDGFIVNVKPIQPREQTLEQGEDVVNGLFHYGVRGMRWGVRKAEKPKTPQEAVAISRINATRRGKTKVKAEGGTLQDASPDALKVAAKTQTLKKSGVKALSNDDLREVANRIRLENEVRELTANRGQKVVKKFLGDQTKQTINREAQEFVKRQSQKKN